MEIEAKFRIPGEQVFEHMLQMVALAHFSLGQVSLADLHDQYLDTAGGAMQAAGLACRLRRTGDGYLATLKSLGGVDGAIHRRLEHQVALEAPLSPPDWPPSAARDLALRLCGNQPLVVLFEIQQARHSRAVYRGDLAVAELSLDRVRFLLRGHVVSTSLELEVELLADGQEEDLQQLVQELQTTWNLLPETQSKFERGLALSRKGMVANGLGIFPDRAPEAVSEGLSGNGLVSVSAEETLAGEPHGTPEQVELLKMPGIEPDDPMSEAGRKILRFHYQRMIYNEPGTRAGEDIEALHDMRVATRRMRAAFRVFGGYYDSEFIAPFLKGLKRTGRALGAVRDLDVFRQKIDAYLQTLSPGQEGDLDDFLAVVEDQRQKTRQQMLAHLDSPKYRRFVQDYGAFVETEALGSLPMRWNGEEPRPYRVRHVAPMTIYERLAAVRAYDEWVTVPDPPLARLHSLRIACKRLRYTLEFFGEVLGSDTDSLVKEAVNIQDHLGDLQDAVVASAILRDFLVWGTWGHDAGDKDPSQADEAVVDPGVATYLAAKQSELQNLLNTFPEAWQRLTGTNFSRMVAESVVGL